MPVPKRGRILIRFCIIPYYSIVFPLTAVSAFLLLSVRRHSTPGKTTEPIAAVFD